MGTRSTPAHSATFRNFATTPRLNVSMMLQPGVYAPDCKAAAVVKNELGEIDLKDFRGKYVVLLFYPADFTFVCPTEILAYSDRADEIRSAGAEVIGISCDSAFTHQAYVKTDKKDGGL